MMATAAPTESTRPILTGVSQPVVLLRTGIGLNPSRQLKAITLGTLRDSVAALTRWRKALASHWGRSDPRVIPGRPFGLYAVRADEGARVMKRRRIARRFRRYPRARRFGFPGARGAGAPFRLSRLDSLAQFSLLHDDSRPGEPRRRAPRPTGGTAPPANPSTRGVGHAECRTCGTPFVIQPQQHARDCPLHDPATCRICGQELIFLSEQELSELRAWSNAKHAAGR